MIQREDLYLFDGGANVAHQVHSSNLYNDEVLESSLDSRMARVLETSSMKSLLFSLSILKEKVQDVEPFMSIILSQGNHAAHALHQLTTSSMAFSSMANLIQEIVQTASFMMLSCEQMALGPTQIGSNDNINNSSRVVHLYQEPHTMQKANDILAQHSIIGANSGVSKGNIIEGLMDGDSFNHYQASKNINQELEVSQEDVLPEPYDLVEVDAADLLARYSHYCQVCGRGFKREANLRMHMRAHGDKSTPISKTLKKISNEESSTTRPPPRKYSCPQKGCRWNKNHVKFQPLKSMVCVRNHYKRSHCPKMFMCNRCNRKEFSILSDLKTHEKNCGNIKWYCSCGTTFSKKDKLMDHIALFVDHIPLIHPQATFSDSSWIDASPLHAHLKP